MLALTTLFDAKTTGTSNWVPVQGFAKDLVFFATGNGTTSGGTLILEESDDPGSKATASQIASIAMSSITGDVKGAYHIALGAGMYVRGRISSDVTGGGTLTLTVAGW